MKSHGVSLWAGFCEFSQGPCDNPEFQEAIMLDDTKRDIDSLLPPTEQNRRQFVVTKLAAGFALAVQPISAQTITTDTTGLTAGEVKIPVPDGEIPGYRAMPAKEGRFATVLVVQEIFGVHEHIKDICRRLAKLGYFAIAPELYARQGDVSKLSSIQEIFGQVVSKVPDAQVMSDLDATVAYAAKSGKADTSKLAITGYCWGGRIVWLYAAHRRDLKAGAAWYGRLTGNSTELTPKHPLDVAGQLNAPVLGLYAEKDGGIPLDTVEKMKAALKAAGKTGSDIIVYPGAAHGFYADYRPSYNKEAASDAWQKMLAHFKKHGVA
jgi:carboxymethylenebutenolidase